MQRKIPPCVCSVSWFLLTQLLRPHGFCSFTSPAQVCLLPVGLGFTAVPAPISRLQRESDWPTGQYTHLLWSDQLCPKLCVARQKLSNNNPYYFAFIKPPKNNVPNWALFLKKIRINVSNTRCYLIVLLRQKGILSPNLTTFLYRNPGFFLTTLPKDFIKKISVLTLDLLQVASWSQKVVFVGIVPFSLEDFLSDSLYRQIFNTEKRIPNSLSKLSDPL